MNKETSVLLLLPHLDLGGGGRRVKVYCDFLPKFGIKPVVCIYSQTVVRSLKTTLGEATPHLISGDLTQIMAFAGRHQVKVVYTFYDGQFHRGLSEILTSFKAKGVKVITNNVFSYYDQRMDDLADAVVFQTLMMMVIKFFKNLPSPPSATSSKYFYLPNPVHSPYLDTFRLTPTQRQKLPCN